jgi:excisionase family DNA binding protein
VTDVVEIRLGPNRSRRLAELVADPAPRREGRSSVSDSVRNPYAHPFETSVDAGSQVNHGFGVPGTRSPFLVVEEVAERLRCSRRAVHELTRTCRIPHRRIAGTRRCLFLELELVEWEAGANSRFERQRVAAV